MTDKIKLAEELLEEYHDEKEKGLPHYSQKQIAVIIKKSTGSSISQQTLSRWDRTDMSEEAREVRLSHRIWNSLLEMWMENEVHGLVFYGRLHHESIGSKVIQRYIDKRFEVRVNPDWIVDWKHRHHLVSHFAKFASENELTEAAVTGVAEVIQQIRFLFKFHNLKASQLYAVDKMYVGSKILPSREIGPKGLCVFPDSLLLNLVIPLFLSPEYNYLIF